MKTVFSNSMVAHTWAQQNQGEGRNSNRSFSFRGEVLYSYATPIAAFTKGADDSRVVLMTSHSYSLTTAGHLSDARRAVHGAQIFRVPDIGHSGGCARTERIGKNWAAVHRKNLAALGAEYVALVAKLSRVQSWYWTMVGEVDGRLMECASIVTNYAVTFGLNAPKIDIEADAARIWARCERLNAERAKPGYESKRQQQREKAAAAREAREQKERELRAMDDAQHLAGWRAGESLAGYRVALPDGSAALRRRGANVETSLGAVVPVEHAARVLRVLDKIRQRGEMPWSRPDGMARESFTLGSFTLDAFDERGIRAGCHFISWSEIEALRFHITSLEG